MCAGLASDKAPFAVDGDRVPAAQTGKRDGDGTSIVLAVLVLRALEYLTVQRASVSLRAALAGSSGQMSGPLPPALTRAFSSPVIRCSGAAISGASTSWPSVGL